MDARESLAHLTIWQTAMQQDILQTLEQTFGFTRFRPGQGEAIAAVVAGRSAAAIFPTGSGKSLCYQLAALHRPRLTLVVSPLLALMQDQLAFLADRGIAAASIDSTQTREEASDVMQGVRDGRIRILMISVERLKNERFRNFIRQVPISLMVVDEAHCISEWGHNFRPDYLKLPVYQRELGIPQVLLLTATATPRVIADMQARFAIDDADVIRTGAYRPNLHLDVEGAAPETKIGRLAQWLSPRGNEAGIVYVTLQKTAETVAAQLRKRGIDAHAYHAGMANDAREALQQRFMAGEIACVVATIAFGMGIDKADIRYVVHFDLPKSIENYSQEIGRAGRDGQPSRCLVLADRDNLHVLENFVYGDTPERDGIHAVIAQINEVAATRVRGPDGDGGSGDWEVGIVGLSQRCNIRVLPLKTLLVQLELRGIIAPKYTYFAEYRFKYLIEPEELAARFRGERHRFVRAIIDHAPRARTWATLDFNQLFQAYREGEGAPRNRVIAALDHFVAQGWIELESRQSTEVYRVLADEIDVDGLATELDDYFKRTEQSEIARIQAMLAFFESDVCLSHSLARYFGDDAAPTRCGHCLVCEGRTAHVADGLVLPPLEKQSFAELCGDFLDRYQTQLERRPSTEAVTRFLCGITTPESTRLKVRAIPGFATLERYRYAEVRQWAKQHLVGVTPAR